MHQDIVPPQSRFSTQVLRSRSSVILWICRLALSAAFIFYAAPKLFGFPESIELFTQLGAEPYLRYVIGVAEVLASGLLLNRKTMTLGSGLITLIMGGAIAARVSKLGFGEEGPLELLFISIAFVVVVLSQWEMHKSKSGRE